MSTRQLSSRGGLSLRNVTGAIRAGGAPERLAVALALVILYAAFAHGAVSSPDEPRMQVAVAAIAALAAAVWLWRGPLRIAAPAFGWIAVALLAAFTLWSGISLAWSVYPDGTWLEVNRYLTYTVVLLLALMLGASTRRAVHHVQLGFLGVAALVTLYAIGQKLVPWVHVPGLLNLDKTGSVPRLQQPLGYWNALGLFLSMAVPPALAVVLDRAHRRRLRLAALVLLTLMFLTIGLTYSRGGLVSLALGVIVAIWLSGSRLRGLMWLALAGAAAVVPLVLGLVSHTLTTPNVGLAARSRTGAELLVVVVVFAGGLIIAGRRLMTLERTVVPTPARIRGIGRALAGAVAAGVVVVLLALTLSHHGVSSLASHAWHSFTTTRGLSNTDPNRLLSADSGNRWVWWKEALGAFSSKPVGGWGAGSFPVVHLLYRRNTLSVKQPHSVPLQYLAETGIVGAVLAIGAFVALLFAAGRALRRRPERERVIAAALFGAGLAYAIHACYDWDADIPGVTLPALVMLGALVGSAPRAESNAQAAFGGLPSAARRLPVGPGPATRLLGLVLASGAMAAYALSATLPSLAATKAAQAVIGAAAGSGTSLREADRTAVLASSLDPLSDAGLRVEATIAQRRGDYVDARQDLVKALRRVPSDGQAWLTLAYLEILAGRPNHGLAAVQQAVRADPQGYGDIVHTGTLAQSAITRLARPGHSATAISTPQTAAAVP